MAKKVLVPIPAKDFGPSETAIPWKIISQCGHEVIFATPHGQMGKTDPIMLTGKGLGLLKELLRANSDARDAYEQMSNAQAFMHPISWSDIESSQFDAILFPGGHAKGVREILESQIIQKLAYDFLSSGRPTAAVCHGVLVLARAKDPLTGKSLLYHKKTTALTKSGELSAYYLTRAWMGNYYLTYPDTTVEDEVKENLASPAQFLTGPPLLLRDSTTKLNRGFVVRDDNYLSARWPGDLHKFSMAFCDMLTE